MLKQHRSSLGPSSLPVPCRRKSGGGGHAGAESSNKERSGGVHRCRAARFVSRGKQVSELAVSIFLVYISEDKDMIYHAVGRMAC